MKKKDPPLEESLSDDHFQGGIEISIQNHQRKYPLNLSRIRSWSTKILGMEQLKDAEVSLVFVNNRRIRIYNKSYRKIDRATDVLSFPMLEGEAFGLHPSLLGDIMISLEMTEKEARLYSRSFDEQLLILLIHGMLHLLGYDHVDTEVEAVRMENRERLILKHLMDEHDV